MHASVSLSLSDDEAKHYFAGYHALADEMKRVLDKPRRPQWKRKRRSAEPELVPISLIPPAETEDERRREEWNKEAGTELETLDQQIEALNKEAMACSTDDEGRQRYAALVVEVEELEERSRKLWIDILTDLLARMKKYG